eukprot:4141345-Amphidinium_carterae.1
MLTYRPQLVPYINFEGCARYKPTVLTRVCATFRVARAFGNQNLGTDGRNLDCFSVQAHCPGELSVTTNRIDQVFPNSKHAGINMFLRMSAVTLVSPLQ